MSPQTLQRSTIPPVFVNVPGNPHGLFAAMGCVYECWEVTCAAGGLLYTSGNWKTSLEELEVHPAVLCFRVPISVKVTSSGEDGWECEEGDWVWYPLEGLPGLGLALPVELAYRITPPSGLLSIVAADDFGLLDRKVFYYCKTGTKFLTNWRRDIKRVLRKTRFMGGKGDNVKKCLKRAPVFLCCCPKAVLLSSAHGMEYLTCARRCTSDD